MDGIVSVNPEGVRKYPPGIEAPGSGLAIRLPLLAAGMISLLAGLWAGIARLGIPVPLPVDSWYAAHGPLMVCAFVGTLVCLERAVGLGRRWALLLPLLSALSALCLLSGKAPQAAAAFSCAAAAGLVSLFAYLYLRKAALPVATLGVGAACWLVGNFGWALGWSVPEVLPWWISFLLLTIAGERLELNRFLPPGRGVQGSFIALAAAVPAACALGPWNAALAYRGLGAAALGLSIWLLRNDVARRTVRQDGLTRFIALCLLAGFLWLGVFGALSLWLGSPVAGPRYDALAHSFFVGFAFSMIFGHAPIVFPAIVGREISFRRFSYIYLALLHGGLMIRVVGDLLGRADLRQAGGLFNVAAILLFALTTAASLRGNAR